MEDKLRIFITPEEIAPDEPELIARVLDQGWHMAHLRHPAASLTDMRRLIEAVPQRYHSRLRLHGHFSLAAEFNLGGLHLNARCPQAPAFYSGPVSRSCHTIEEVVASTDCDYVTLSPIFNSISKPGYHAAFSHEQLASLNHISAPRIIALGGITPDTVKALEPYRFAGWAVKGAIHQFLNNNHPLDQLD